MKKTIGIILGVVLGCLIVLGVVIFIVISSFFPFNQDISVASPSPTNFAVKPDSSGSAAALPTKASPTTAPSPTPAKPSPAPPAQPTPKATPEPQDVSFTMGVSSFRISGATSGTVVAQIVNTGSADAHNAWIKVEIYSQDMLVKVDGEDFFRKDLGTIKAGSTITPQATINVSLRDGLRILANGARFELTIFCDEGSQSVSYTITPRDIFQ
jgi:cytoskeletal protein RodZ